MTTIAGRLEARARIFVSYFLSEAMKATRRAFDGCGLVVCPEARLPGVEIPDQGVDPGGYRLHSDCNFCIRWKKVLIFNILVTCIFPSPHSVKLCHDRLLDEDDLTEFPKLAVIGA